MPLGYGITNLVARTTATADQLSAHELAEGARLLEQKVARYAPKVVAVLGVGAYRMAFARPKAVLGPQSEELAGARLWLLPSPSGLNAHYQLPQLAALFAEVREAAARMR